MPRVYAAIDVFCLPSLSEGLGTVALEAMASGIPVVGSRVGGIPEAILDGETGFLVPPRDSQDLSRAIGKLAAEPGLRSGFGENGRQRVLANFTETLLFERTDEVYERVLRTGIGASVEV